uniref:Uncharacterized protein n=1 Tax=Pavo cristatus TaxID=9049 RepID=A0A8C9EJ06_PAVCR
MEIKEERASDEAQQFLPSSQIDSLGEPQLTSKLMKLNSEKFVIREFFYNSILK